LKPITCIDHCNAHPVLSILLIMNLGITTKLSIFFPSRLLSLFLFSSALGVVVSAMATSTSPSRCAVVGVGVLGTSLCEQILSSADFADTTVTGITKTTNNHESIREKVGAAYSDRLRLMTTDEAASRGEKFRDVCFCAPPSGSDDYAGAVADAVENIWAGSEGGGVFVFTSSGGVYGAGEYGTVTEATPIPETSRSPRTERLASAESASLQKGGCCVRLAGLYNLNRGAHNYWLTSGNEVTGAPDGIINLLHYEDAAASCLAAFRAGPSVCSGKIFLISDGHPISRKEICESGLKSKSYKDYSMPVFTGGECFALGKIYDGSESNRLLKFSPKYSSFDEFMASH
jgi:nucleoside-diphosphate-sugar epimerase